MFTDRERDLLVRGAEELGVSLDELAVNRFELYFTRLHEANANLNLTRIPPEKTVSLHFLDSLTLVKAVPVNDGASLLDIGTGAGMPGLALAIAFPTIRTILLDATRKKLDFLNGLVTELGIDNVRLVHCRAEDLAQSGMYRMFDVVTARAVAATEKLAAWMAPFVNTGGYAIAYKSSDARDEIESAREAIVAAGCRLDRIVEVRIPGEDITRLLAVISGCSTGVRHVKGPSRSVRVVQHRGSRKKGG